MDAYLAHPVPIKDSSWKKYPQPDVVIPDHLRQLADGPTDYDRGLAVGQLVFSILSLSTEKQAHPAARDLMEKIVMPNLAYTKLIEEQSVWSWQSTILFCARVYQRLGDAAAEQRCLVMLQREGPQPEGREMGTYMLAYWHVAQQDYPSAIATIKSLPPASIWANNRAGLIAEWKKHQAQKEQKKKTQQTQQTPPKAATVQTLPR